MTGSSSGKPEGVRLHDAAVVVDHAVKRTTGDEARSISKSSLCFPDHIKRASSAAAVPDHEPREPQDLIAATFGADAVEVTALFAKAPVERRRDAMSKLGLGPSDGDLRWS